MFKDKKAVNRSGVDKGLVAMFIKMSPEERLRANDKMFRAILELRDAYKRRKTNEPKSKDPKDKQRLPVLKETLRQLEGENGGESDDYDGNADNE